MLVNECEDGSHNCSQICVDTDEFYTCKCHADYVLDEDGRTCHPSKIISIY